VSVGFGLVDQAQGELAACCPLPEKAIPCSCRAQASGQGWRARRDTGHEA
jgi:hypothetical protein